MHHWKRGSGQEPRRETEGKEGSEQPKKKKKSFCDPLPLNHDNPVDIFLREEGRCPEKSLAISVDARSQK